MIDKKRLFSLFTDLVNINSPSKQEKDLSLFLKNYFKNFDAKITQDEAGKKINANTGNLIIQIKGKQKNKPLLSFWAHMDTVASTENIKLLSKKDRFCTDGNTILGADDKAGIASICEAVTAYTSKYNDYGDIELIFTIAEEIGLMGAKNFTKTNIKAKEAYVLDCNGTPGTFILKAPSADTFTATITGKAAHAGIEPEKGINAIAVASQAIAKMKLGRINKNTTANIGSISGGTARNIIPEQAIIKGEARSFSDIELAKEINSIKECFKQAAKENKAKLTFKIKHEYKTFSLNKEQYIVKRAETAAKNLKLKVKYVSSGGGSDANILNQKGITTLNLGIGMQNAHATNEYILKNDLLTSAKLIFEIIKNQ